MKKKIWCMLLLLLAFTFCNYDNAEARERRYTDGDFQYSYDDDTGYIWIEGYLGDENEVVIPSEIQGTPVKYIYSIGYLHRKTITKVYIPEGIEYVSGFNNCENLQEVNIPSSVTEIGVCAFAGCKKLGSIQLPDGLVTIGEGAFLKCDSLTQVTIPSSVKTIGICAFQECKLLEQVNLSDGLEKIEESAFYGCVSIKEMNIPDSVKKIDIGAFEKCKKLETIKLPKNVTKIGDFTFRYCKNLKSVKLPNRLKSIGWSAFQGSGLEKVTIPKTVNRISCNAFACCKNLKKITFKANKPGNIDKYAFEGIKKKAVFDVPNKSISKYKKVLEKLKGFKKGKMVVK